MCHLPWFPRAAIAVRRAQQHYLIDRLIRARGLSMARRNCYTALAVAATPIDLFKGYLLFFRLELIVGAISFSQNALVSNK